LKYNWFAKTTNPEVIVDPGMVWVGPWTALLKYPKTIQTISYDNSHRDLLDGRTKDGLPLVLGLSFQYQLMPDQLFSLYMEYEQRYGAYVDMYKLMGIHILTEMATNYTAYQFFNDKQRIALEMMFNMDKYFRDHLHASVESLQINEDDLPGPFTDMILMAATMKQNISKTQKTLGAKVVKMETAVKVAEAQANVTIQNAIGQSSAIMQNGQADATVISAYVQSELVSYSLIKEKLGLKGDDLLKYIWYDAVGGGSVVQPGADFTVFSGVHPGAYMTEK
jgi:regulator of protease activity HflC (stomatin/prohibitin superfamily)